MITLTAVVEDYNQKGTIGCPDSNFIASSSAGLYTSFNLSAFVIKGAMNNSAGSLWLFTMLVFFTDGPCSTVQYSPVSNINSFPYSFITGHYYPFVTVATFSNFLITLDLAV